MDADQRSVALLIRQYDREKINIRDEEHAMNNRCDLASRQCVPCQGGIPPLKGELLTGLLAQLGHGWQVINEHHLEKRFKFKNFMEALAFTNKVGEIAENQDHHPEIALGWGKVILTIWTHKIGGLTESDFILAAKVEQIEADQ